MKNDQTTLPADRRGRFTFIYIIILFIGLHSIILGLFIYFFTDLFYMNFFSTNPENVFYVKQAGIFLFLDGLVYLFPILNLPKYYHLITLTIISKITAVLFLISNASHTPAPSMIYLASIVDGLMAAILVPVYIAYHKKIRVTGYKSEKCQQISFG